MKNKVVFPELVNYDKSRVGHVMFILPALDITEPGEFLAGEGYDGFALAHFLGHVLVCTRGYARAAHFCCVGYCFEYSVDISLVRGIGYHHVYSVIVNHYKSSKLFLCC